MTTEPGWVAENLLATSLGWTVNKDFDRDASPETYWGKFQRLDERVWKVKPRPGVEWVRARYIEDRYCLHESYLTLEQALRGEKDKTQTEKQEEIKMVETRTCDCCNKEVDQDTLEPVGVQEEASYEVCKDCGDKILPEEKEC